MNKKIYIVIIIIFTIIISGCSKSSNKEEILSTNIEKLISQEVHELSIKQLHGNYYSATQEFISRLLDKLKDYKLEERQIDEKKNFDAILNFKGFQQIFLNSEYGYFWFENSQQVYKITELSSNLWKRLVLKEIDGQITYYSFEKDILCRSYIGLYEKPQAEEVLLYYDGDIRLKVKDKAITVLSNVPEDCIESLIPSNQMLNRLYIKEDSEKEKNLFLVGSTYSHTNKYGSMSWVSCYEYDGEELKEIWNTNNLLNSTIVVKEYDDDSLALEIKEQNIEFKIKLYQDEISMINEYIKFLQEVGQEYIGREDFLFFSNLTEYKLYDYNNDGSEELITKVNMRGGASGITENIYFIYDFTEEGINLKDILPARNNLINYESE